MSYGLTFYRPNTTEFDASIAAKNAADPSYATANYNARILDSDNTLASRGQVLEAFQNLSKAPINPTEAQIRQWMVSGLGYKKQTFINAQNSYYAASTSYAAQIVADRAFENNLKALSISQADNENGNPSQSTQDQFNNNKTSFLLGADNGKDYREVVNNLTVTGYNTPLRDYRFYNGATFDGTCYFFTQINNNYLDAAGSSAYSIEMWINPSRTGHMSLMSRIKAFEGFTSPIQFGYDLFINAANNLVWELPPYHTITSPGTIPINTWTHIAIAYDSVNARRLMFINGQKVAERTAGTYYTTRTIYTNNGVTTETDFNEVQTARITTFANSSTYYYGYWTNAVYVNSTKGFSIGDKVKIYGYLPTGESYTGTEGYIYDINPLVNIIQIEGGISLTGVGTLATTFTSKVGYPLLVRTGVYNTSASYRGVVARSVTNANRLYLDPIARPFPNSTNPITYGYSGVAERSWIDTQTGYRNSYQPGERVIFTGVSRGGIVLNRVYYITSVVPSDSTAFGGYITISTANTGYSTNQDFNFDYFTDNGQTLQMYINKIPDYNVGSSVYCPGQRTTMCFSDAAKTGSAANPPFEGILGGIRQVTSATAYTSNFTPSEVLNSYTGLGSTNLLINKTDGAVPTNSGASLALGYTNAANILVYAKPSYLGAVAFNGSSSYSTVSGGTFVIPSGTDWCAEAWIFPIKLRGGIIGSGATGSGYWAITLGTDGKVTFTHENFSINSDTTILSVKNWYHIAVTLNGNILKMFINGVTVATTTISPVYFRPNSSDSKYYIGKHVNDYFIGYIASPRLVVGKSIYTTNFTPNTSLPKASRASVLNAYAANPSAPVIPDEGDIQYWMVRGFDTFLTPFFKTTDITWNQVDSFYVNGNTTVDKTYSVCVDKEILVTQILIGTPDIRQAYYSNVITTNSAAGTVHVTGGTVDAYITVFMR